ncbi:MAG: D-glycero-beta-D-manno-heptose-7-phosphate kinase [candidate division NC10 bacterium]|nr:D-glycero-beta-D-manno-heptose-7-phosphate kinase [candidate division NC10 bacterium]
MPQRLSVAQTSLVRHIARFPRCRVLILGDVMLDEYMWGTVSRISPEAPVPVVAVRSESVKVGGAGNVAANVAALGGQASLIGLMGNDAAAERLCHELELAGVKSDGLIVDRTRPTTIKSRVVAGSQHVVRFDRESDVPASRAIQARVLGAVRERLPSADALLISDYAKGLVGPGLVRDVLALAARQRRLVAVDPKVQHLSLFKGVTVVAPNHHEAAAAARLPVRNEADLIRVGRVLLRRLKTRAVLITRGEQGMSLFEAGKSAVHIPTVAREVYDVTGAGDTVMGALSLALAAGADMHGAAVIANYAAGVVVGKRGTATVTRAELERALRDGNL